MRKNRDNIENLILRVRGKVMDYGGPGLDRSPPLDIEVAAYLETYATILENIRYGTYPRTREGEEK